jgi:peptidoglycan/xylan/chitin deacetylase (PgdA/CDA1 family)
MIPRSRKTRLLRLLPSALVVTRLSGADKVLYLTFDDGPDSEHTPPILDLLRDHGATASFFLIGDRVDAESAVVDRIVAEGHQLGNHSWTHPFMSDLPLVRQLDEIDRTDRKLAEFDGIARHPFRPPCGVLPLNLLWHYAVKRRAIAYWSYDSHDYQRLPPDELVRGMAADPPRSGDVVLMHDDSAVTSAALAVVLPEWRRQGFEVRALPALNA